MGLIVPTAVVVICGACLVFKIQCSALREVCVFQTTSEGLNATSSTKVLFSKGPGVKGLTPVWLCWKVVEP